MANSTIDNMQAIVNYIKSTSTTSEAIKALLPVMYATVDPRRIPTEDLSATTEPPEAVLVALEGLYLFGKTDVVIKYAPESSPDVWSRAWSWLCFFEQCKSFEWTLGVDRLPQIVIRLIHRLYQHSPTHEKIVRTEGALRIFGKSWRCVLPVGGPFDNIDDSLRTLKFLAHPLLSRRFPRLPELVEAVGSCDDLALLIMHHFRYSSRGEASLTELEIMNLINVLNFIIATDALIDPLDDDGFSPISQLGEALIRCRAVQSLSKVLCKLGNSAVHLAQFKDISEDIDTVCFVTAHVLCDFLKSRSGFLQLPSAILRGLLSSLMRISTSIQLPVCVAVRCFFADVLPRALIWSNVLSAVHSVWKDVLACASCPVFRASIVFEAWQPLENLITERLAVFNQFNSSAHRSFKLCYNRDVCHPTHTGSVSDFVQCGRIEEEKIKFRRCGGCKAPHYCSRACQRNDWVNGGHKAACNEHCLTSAQERVPGECRSQSAVADVRRNQA